MASGLSICRTDLDIELPEPLMCQDYENSFTECDDSEDPELCSAPGCGRHVCRKHATMINVTSDVMNPRRPFCAQCTNERRDRQVNAAFQQVLALLEKIANTNGVLIAGVLESYGTGEKTDVKRLLREVGLVA